MADPTNKPYAMAVDDDPLILMHIADILDEAGFRCLEASSADEAKQVVEAHAGQIVLLFSDVEMPGSTNGFGLAHHVSENWPTIEIVIASGRLKPEPGDLPDKATFIAKPFSAKIVYDHLIENLPADKMPKSLRSRRSQRGG